MTTCVVTDPSAVMPDGAAACLGIRLVPLDIVWPDGASQPGDLPYSAIADRLASGGTPPTTGAPSPGTYAELARELLATHDGVLVVCPSSDLSATFQSARLGATETGDDRVLVLDSKTAAAGQGLVAMEAARVASGTATLSEVCDRAVAVASRVQIWATLSEVGFLRRSGRIPAIAAIGVGALGIHPVVRYDGASPTLAAVTRSSARALDRLCAAWQRSFVPGAVGRAIAFHCARADDADDLCERIRRRSPGGSCDPVEVNSALASHTGPGLLGLAWFWDN